MRRIALMYGSLLTVVVTLLALLPSSVAYADNEQKSETYRRNFVTSMMKEAEQGDAHAQLHLGTMYEKGIGVAKDEAEAVEWYREAAEQGSAMAQSILGLMYSYGRGVTKDEAEAMRWWREGAQSRLREFANAPTNAPFKFGGFEGQIKAAESGNKRAQAAVGMMYLTGSGVTQSDVEAVYWLTEAGAEQALAILYEEGRGGLPKDNAEAMRLYRKWAEQVSHISESSVRMVYEFGPM